MADASVRPAGPDDASAIAALLVDEWVMGPSPEATALAASLDRDEVAASWREAAARPPARPHLLLVACEGPLVVGVLAAAPDEGGDSEILELVVAPGRRRHGHGSRLLSAWADLARESECTGGTAWVRASDEEARGFLQGAGWGPDGGRRTLDPTGEGVGVILQARLVTALSDATADAPD